ncbi:MAG: hypothetical protein E6K52_11680 [Gammaproteobacteria bacterium]|nr:MAG: hypothetical protein E6K52_11680 [Gammaproteobacteria bacterium]
MASETCGSLSAGTVRPGVSPRLSTRWSSSTCAWPGSSGASGTSSAVRASSSSAPRSAASPASGPSRSGISTR